MSAWTLAYLGTTKSAADWGVSRLQRRLSSQATGGVAFEVPVSAMESGEPFAVNETLKIYRDGVQWFQGRLAQMRRVGSGNAEVVVYTVASPWWWLENLVFMRAWLGTYSPRIALNWTGSALGTTAQQITSILQWVLARAGSPAPFAIGNILAGTSLTPPIDEVRDVTCDEAVRRELRWHPDAVAYFDFSTDPPTLHIAVRGALAAVTLQFPGSASAGYLLGGCQVVPRYDLVRPSVAIRYEVRNATNGQEEIAIIDDVAGGTGLEAQALVATVDLAGVQRSVVGQELVTETIQPDSLDWWKARFPMMLDARVTELTLISASRKSGSLVLPYEVIEGAVHPWMYSGAVEAVSEQEEVIGTFSFKLMESTASGAKEVKVVTECKVPYKFTSTNMPSGWYTNETIDDYGDPQPVGLANALYQATKDLQHDGEVEILQAEATGLVKVGDLVTITELGVSNALVQEVAEDVDNGVTTVRFGAPRHLGVSDLVELLRVNRVRSRPTPKSAFADGALGDAGNVRLGAPGANTFSPTDSREFMSVLRLKPSSTGASKITLDAIPTSEDANSIGRFVMEDGAGRKINVRIADAQSPKGTPKEIKLREVEVCVNGVTKRAIALISEPYDAGA